LANVISRRRTSEPEIGVKEQYTNPECKSQAMSVLFGSKKVWQRSDPPHLREAEVAGVPEVGGLRRHARNLERAHKVEREGTEGVWDAAV
jgi:hypothetical protein